VDVYDGGDDISDEQHWTGSPSDGRCKSVDLRGRAFYDVKVRAGVGERITAATTALPC
jgi:hypothetical protein